MGGFFFPCASAGWVVPRVGWSDPGRWIVSVISVILVLVAGGEQAKLDFFF